MAMNTAERNKKNIFHADGNGWLLPCCSYWCLATGTMP